MTPCPLENRESWRGIISSSCTGRSTLFSACAAQRKDNQKAELLKCVHRLLLSHGKDGVLAQLPRRPRCQQSHPILIADAAC
jgi:hypothetical protein